MGLETQPAASRGSAGAPDAPADPPVGSTGPRGQNVRVTPDPTALDDAAWIGSPLRGTALPGAPAPLLRTRFELEAAPAKATLSIMALGVYEAELDGVRVGDVLLEPGWTDYARRLPVQTHDLTDRGCPPGGTRWG